MRVVTFSRNRRSCDTSMTVPSKPTRASSRISAAGMSRWLVGSSRKSRLRGLEQQLRQREARALAAREARDHAQRVVTPEAEAGEVLPRRLDGEVAAHLADVVDRGERSGPPRRGAGRSIPPAGWCPRLHRALVAVLTASGEELQQRRLAGAVGPDDADALAATHEEVDAPRRARALPAPRRGPSRRARCRRSAGRARSGTRRARRSPTRPPGARGDRACSSILRRLCACLVFWPAMFLRMKSSVLRDEGLLPLARGRARARGPPRARRRSPSSARG